MSFEFAPLAFSVERLPTLNAALNATAAVLLVAGYVSIRRGRERLHKSLMLAAFGVSVVFLTSYLIYHAQVGAHRFEGPPAVRAVYLVILVTHVVLAAAVPFLAITSIYLGLRDRRSAHRKLVRWTFPIWLYVSVTGVVVYWMLYHLYPASTADGTIPQRQTEPTHRSSALASTPSAPGDDVAAE